MDDGRAMARLTSRHALALDDWLTYEHYWLPLTKPGMPVLRPTHARTVEG